MIAPTLSVITANYNHGKFVGRAIEAVACQSRRPDEYIVLDDGSTDNSVEIISSYVQRFPFIRFERHHRNMGLLVAQERLLELATGEYICGTAADDYILPGFLENAMDMAVLYPSAGLIFGIPVIYNSDGDEIGMGKPLAWNDRLFANPKQFLDDYLSREHPGMTPSAATVYRRNALRDVGHFRSNLESYCDAFAIQAIGLRHGICYFPERSSAVRIDANTYSGQAAADPHKMLTLISRATSLMRSEEFSPYFPTEYVDYWEKRFRESVIEDYLDTLQRLHDKAELACRYGMSRGSALERGLSWFLGKASGLHWRIREMAIKKILSRTRYS